MIQNWQTKKFKGFAYIDYKDTASVKKSIKHFHGKDFQGRKLILDGVVTEMKKGFKRPWV
jgi:RNA recognition motif-containing protein